MMVQTWVLKVTIHCDGCKKKVKKVLQKVQGVYTIDIDSNQNRVTVTGDVDGESLVRKLLKYGKHSELLTEKNQTVANSSSAAANSSSAVAGDAETKGEEKVAEHTKQGKHVDFTTPKIDGDAPSNGGEVKPSELENGDSEKPAAAVAESKKKGKEVEIEENREDEAAVYESGSSPPANAFIVEHQPVYTLSYSAVHPSTSYAYYQAPPEMPLSYGYTAYPPPAIYPQPATYSPAETYSPEYNSQEYYPSESYYGSMESQSGSYDMFNEENPNACNLM